jgi:hypothetical protein
MCSIETVMLEIKPDRFYLAMWYFDIPPGFTPEGPKGGNWMGCVWRELSADQPWVFQYRFRYYRGPDFEKPFNDPNDPMKSVDELHWWQGKVRGHAGAVLKSTARAIATMAAFAGSVPDVLMLGCTGDQAGFKMRDSGKLWLHCRVQKVEDDHFAS